MHRTACLWWCRLLFIVAAFIVSQLCAAFSTKIESKKILLTRISVFVIPYILYRWCDAWCGIVRRVSLLILRHVVVCDWCSCRYLTIRIHSHSHNVFTEARQRVGVAELNIDSIGRRPEPKNFFGRMQNNDKKCDAFLLFLVGIQFGVSWYEYHDCNFRHAIGRRIRYDWLTRKDFSSHAHSTTIFPYSIIMCWDAQELKFRLEIGNWKKSVNFLAANNVC